MVICLLNGLFILCCMRRVKRSRSRANVARRYSTTFLTLPFEIRLKIYKNIFAGKKVWLAIVRPLPSGLLVKLNHTKTSPLRVSAFMNSTELVCSTLFSNIPCGNFKLWQHSNALQPTCLSVLVLNMQQTLEVFVRIKNSIIHYPDWKVMDIVREWLLKRYLVRGGR